MNSTEKAYTILEQMAEMSDGEIADALPVPIPPTMARTVIGFIAPRIPSDPHVLDEFLTNVGDFCHSLRSDAAPTPA